MNVAPETIVAKAAFRNKTVDMRIPFKITAKSMETIIKPGVKFLDLLVLKNMRETTLLTA